MTQRFQPDDIRFKDGGFGEKGEVENGLNLAQRERGGPKLCDIRNVEEI